MQAWGTSLYIVLLYLVHPVRYFIVNVILAPKFKVHSVHTSIKRYIVRAELFLVSKQATFINCSFIIIINTAKITFF